MPKRLHSTMILAIVFVLGTSAGVAAMLWAWPAFRQRFPTKPPRRIDVMTRTLDLTPQQVTQIHAVFKELEDKGNAMYASEFAPQYSKVCDEWTGIRTKQRQEFAPIAQQEDAKLRTILTAAQAAKWDEQMKQYQHRQASGNHRPDGCHGLSGPGGPGGPGGHGGPPHGNGPGGPPPPGRFY